MTRPLWLALAVLVSLLTTSPVNASPLPIQTLSYGISSGYQLAATLIIRDNTTWQTFWNNLTSIEAPPQRPPTPDFTNQMAVAAMMGPQPTCSSSIHVQSLSIQNGELQINVTKVYGKDGNSLCPADISPYHVVQTQRFDGPSKTNTAVQGAAGRGTPLPTLALPIPAIIFSLAAISLLFRARARSLQRKSTL